MRKITIVSILVISLVMFCWISVSSSGVTLEFDFYNVSETYMKFYYEFGSRFGELKKNHFFSGSYNIRVLEGMGRIKFHDGTLEEDLVIVVLINNEKKPSFWARTRALSSEKEIKKKAKEFAEKTFKKLRELERQK